MNNKNHITVLIKPASSNCNMLCKYCFYVNVAKTRQVTSYGLMTKETAHNLIDKALQFAGEGGITFSFQGGEPTLHNIGYYEDFVTYVNAQNIYGTQIEYCLQTNGTTLNEKTVRFYAEHNFLIGISLDGDRETNDSNRVFPDGSGTFNKIINGIELLKMHNVNFNILSVVNRASADKGKQIYKFFTGLGIEHMQFINCLEPFNSTLSHGGFSLDGEQYFNFYRQVFDEYLYDLKNGKNIYIRNFENIFAILKGLPPESCNYQGHCSVNLVVESNGNCYPCDFYCTDNYLLGNINSNSLEQVACCQNAQSFVESSYKIDEECLSCSVAFLCRGGCRRERATESTVSKNRYCEGKKKLYAYILRKL